MENYTVNSWNTGIQKKKTTGTTFPFSRCIEKERERRSRCIKKGTAFPSDSNPVVSSAVITDTVISAHSLDVDCSAVHH